VLAQEFDQMLGLAGARAKMDIGEKECADGRHAGTLSGQYERAVIVV